MNKSIGGFLKAYREESWLLGVGLLLALTALLAFGAGIQLYNRETIRSRESAQLEKVNIARSAPVLPSAPWSISTSSAPITSS